MTFVKICGLCNLEDAKLAVELGADALGFNFYSGSPRCLNVAEAQTIVRQVPPSVWRVGIFVDQARDEVEHIARQVGLDTLQFHGSESATYCAQWKSWRVLRALRPESSQQIPEMIEEHRQAADFLLFDRFEKLLAGGTGKEISESILCTLQENGVLAKSFLSGGLSPENVSEKIARYQPFGVDIASGVELTPRKKSADKLRRFFLQTKQR